ncbi:MAG: hypothetical protein RJA10_521 [Pseudomonadota bacterium]
MNTTTVSAPAASAGLFSGGRAGACVGAVALITLLAFEALAVAAAMPAVAAALDGLSLYALAFGGTLAASVPGMVLAGRICDKGADGADGTPSSRRHGAWHATVWGLALFGTGLLLAGLAPHMAVLVAGRVLQGLGGGMLGVTLYVGMGQVVPPALHPRLFSLFATAWVVPGLVGPTLATSLVQHAGWRWVFLAVLAVLPVAAWLLLPALARLQAPAAAAAPRPFSWRLLPAGVLRAAPGLPAVVALRGLLAAAFATAEVFLPLALTRDQGWTLMHAGWVLSSGALFWSLGSALQARLTEPRQRRQALHAGLWLVSTGIAALALVLTWPPAGWPATAAVVACWMLSGLGVGLAFPILSVQLLKISAPDEQGRNASALQLADALASSAALSAAGLLVLQPQGMTGVMALAAAVALLGALCARRVFAPPT